MKVEITACIAGVYAFDRPELECEKREELGLIDILRTAVAPLWSCYNRAVQIVNFPDRSYQQVGASGKCPHCGAISFFQPIGGAHFDQNNTRICNAAQCQACKHFVLVVGRRASGTQEFGLEAFYPLGRPNDQVDPAVPETIAADFREALRCRFVDAFKAAVAMCRRAIQTSCHERGADKKKKLVDQIDELTQRGFITQSLKDMAHEVRLEGNLGAHPDKDGLEDVGCQDADDIIEFTRQYVEHVYVMPAKLQARVAARKASASTP